MIDKSFYHGQQGECFKKLYKHFEDIRHEFFSQSNKIFLSPEDFSNSVRGEPQDYTDEDFFYKGDTERRGDYVQGEWKALGIATGDHEYQNFNDYPMLYSILRKFPYKTNVAIMTVGPNTKIGNQDKYMKKGNQYKYTKMGDKINIPKQDMKKNIRKWEMNTNL